MTPAARRSGVVASTLVVILAMIAPAAIAADDLGDIVERADAATYTATRLTVSVWGDRTSLTRERVEHADGSEMIKVDETWSMVGNGRTISMGDAPAGIAFMTDGIKVDPDRYQVGEVTAVRHMHRPCSLIPILEEGLLRARMLVDDRTGAPLVTYYYDAAGRVFRTVSLSDFTPHRTYEWPEGRTDVPMEIVMHDDATLVPTELGGYVLVDVFPGPAGSEQGFYTDGLFSFSVFVLPASTVVEGFEDPQTMVTDAGVYEAIPTAQDVRVHWSDMDAQYVLVGDLPPDHLATALAGLPEPDTGSMLSRLWRRLFG